MKSDSADEFVAPEAPGQFSADIAGADKYLEEHGWPEGLRKSLTNSLDSNIMRFFIIDNSGSMSTDDGNRLVSAGGKNRKMQRCTRWDELVDTVIFHAELAERAACKTQFRLLNECPPIVLGDRADDGRNLKLFLKKLENAPHGGTPMCRHINDVVNQVVTANAGRDPSDYIPCVLTIFTDGEPSDGLLSEYLAPLVDYPVWIVVRLCTDTESIVEYWDKMDKELEIEMDILDDYVTESRTVNKLNRWLVYGEPVHRIREWGMRLPELDFLDEITLTHQQMYKVCKLILFGSDSKDLPPPDDWEQFTRVLGEKKHAVGKTWDPIRKRMAGWVNMRALNQTYGGGACSIM